MAQKPRSVTIKDVPPEVWQAMKIAAINAGKGISEFVIEGWRKALNGKSK